MSRWSEQRVDVERRLLVRVRAAQRGDHLVVPVGREDRLEPQLGDALLPPRLADRRIGALAAAERSRPGGVPRAALVLADPSRAGLEEGFTNRIERLARDENN